MKLVQVECMHKVNTIFIIIIIIKMKNLPALHERTILRRYYLFNFEYNNIILFDLNTTRSQFTFHAINLLILIMP